VTITLTPAELLVAWTTAGLRRVSSLQDALRDAHGYPGEDPCDDEIAGCVAELAVARATGRHWHMQVRRHHLADVGDLHVRCVRKLTDRLIVRPTDPNGVFVLAYWDSRFLVEVLGWVDSRSARRDEWWQSPNGRPGAWFVPQDALSMAMEGVA
jgi:hypothetical protein